MGEARTERKTLASRGFAAVSEKTWFVGRVLVPDSFREKGQNATRLVSWADQDVERDQEGGKLPMVSMWGSWGRPKEPGCYPLCHPSPIIPGGTCVSWAVNKEGVSNWQRCSYVLSMAERMQTLLNPSLNRSGTEWDGRNSER